MSGWWFATGCVVLFLLLSIYTARRDKRQVIAFAASRASLGREEFIERLATDCEPDVADFLWRTLSEEYSHWDVELTPHPDDNYLEDMPIDPENQQDWLDDFCVANDLRYQDLPPWPDSHATTVRNLARWLSDSRRLADDVAE